MIPCAGPERICAGVPISEVMGANYETMLEERSATEAFPESSR